MVVSIKNCFECVCGLMVTGVEAVGSKYCVIKDDMRFYILLASKYFELRILLDNVRRHTLQLVQFFGIVLMCFLLHS